MYGSPIDVDATKRHLGALTNASYGSTEEETPYGVIVNRIRELADHCVISKEKAEEAVCAFKAWMVTIPANTDPLMHAEQFYAEYEGSEFAYLPA